MRWCTVTLFAWLFITEVTAGYIGLGTTEATQCGSTMVQWDGDEGPYHLLLTPTSFVEHGYNVWIPSIPNGTNTYNLTINQPAGLQYMVTVWGASGISKAGTTDILTVLPALPQNANTNCFLSDDQILSLYTFSFNITNSDNDYPAQCSNVSMTWPTSLEGNVTSGLPVYNSTRRSIESNGYDVEMARDTTVSSRTPASDNQDVYVNGTTTLNQLDTSTSKDGGNTTKPPTMYGLIPLGNSFQLPITFSKSSRFAAHLPETSLSDTPTTYTSQGTTHLNWTVTLAKGTRFILVAGIGSDEQWASGGSSSMMTVGQGNSVCVGTVPPGSDNQPSVTATGTGENTATAVPGHDTVPARKNNSLIGIVLATIFSAVATLAAVVIFFFLRRRLRRRRQMAAVAIGPYTTGKRSREEDRPDTQLDLIASRDGPRNLTPIATDHYDLSSTVATSSSPHSPAYGANPFSDERGSASPSRNKTYDTIISPISTVQSSTMGRQDSREALLAQGSSLSTSSSPIRTLHASSSRNPNGPLILHDMSAEAEFGDEEDADDDDDDVPELKRDTLAYLGDPSAPGPGPLPSRGLSLSTLTTPTSAVPTGRRRRRRSDHEMEYVVHRDAGRLGGSRSATTNRVDLPPRYEEVNWEEEEGAEAEERGSRTR